MSHTLVDPTSERNPTVRPRSPRLPSLAGKKVGFLDISKARGDVFLDRLEKLLVERVGAQVLRFRKPTFSKVAPPDLRQEIAQQCDAVIEALAD